MKFQEVQPIFINGWKIAPCAEDGFDLTHGEERYHHDHMEVAVAAAQRSPRGDETLVEQLIRNDYMDVVEVARAWHAEMQGLTDRQAVTLRTLIGKLLARIDKYEKNLPSWLHGTPEDVDAWIRDLIPEDKRLAFYRWIGTDAVREAVADAKSHLGDNPVPVEHRYYTPDAVEEFLDLVAPGEGDIGYPSKLPVGRVFCDVNHHTHTDGSRLPTCRLDSPE